MIKRVAVVFGEAQRGQYAQPLYFEELEKFYEEMECYVLGAKGIECAVKTLLQNRKILFCRVREEGFSAEDYYQGAQRIRDNMESHQPELLLLPGVGDRTIYAAMHSMVKLSAALCISGKKDLYDYITG